MVAGKDFDVPLNPNKFEDPEGGLLTVDLLSFPAYALLPPYFIYDPVTMRVSGSIPKEVIKTDWV